MQPIKLFVFISLNCSEHKRQTSSGQMQLTCSLFFCVLFQFICLPKEAGKESATRQTTHKIPLGRNLTCSKFCKALQSDSRDKCDNNRPIGGIQLGITSHSHFASPTDPDPLLYTRLTAH
uniref:HDC14371 n=1 Tax=Drosophila melanogaster TaxID=7227 RepID=Q6IJS3_DROME|nr:TPA_inf: HDC14371 [Drosophila melanogaster]